MNWIIDSFLYNKELLQETKNQVYGKELMNKWVRLEDPTGNYKDYLYQ